MDLSTFHTFYNAIIIYIQSCSWREEEMSFLAHHQGPKTIPHHSLTITTIKRFQISVSIQSSQWLLASQALPPTIGHRDQWKVEKRIRVHTSHLPSCHTIYMFLWSVIGRCCGTEVATTFPNCSPLGIMDPSIL